MESNKIDKMLLAGSGGLLILRLLSEGDMYGYQITSELARRSDNTFSLKAGTLYPLLHSLEEKGYVSSYESEVNGKTRKYYRLTSIGRNGLSEKLVEWERYVSAVNGILQEIILSSGGKAHV